MTVRPCDVKCPVCGAGLFDVAPDWEVSELIAGRLPECFARCDRGHHVHAEALQMHTGARCIVARRVLH